MINLVMQPLPTRLVLQKKRAKEGRFGDEIEHFPVPSRVTVRRRSAVAIGELKESGEISVKKVWYFTFQIQINCTSRQIC